MQNVPISIKSTKKSSKPFRRGPSTRPIEELCKIMGQGRRIGSKILKRTQIDRNPRKELQKQDSKNTGGPKLKLGNIFKQSGMLIHKKLGSIKSQSKDSEKDASSSACTAALDDERSSTVMGQESYSKISQQKPPCIPRPRMRINLKRVRPFNSSDSLKIDKSNKILRSDKNAILQKLSEIKIAQSLGIKPVLAKLFEIKRELRPKEQIKPEPERVPKLMRPIRRRKKKVTLLKVKIEKFLRQFEKFDDLVIENFTKRRSLKDSSLFEDLERDCFRYHKAKFTENDLSLVMNLSPALYKLSWEPKGAASGLSQSTLGVEFKLKCVPINNKYFIEQSKNILDSRMVSLLLCNYRYISINDFDLFV